MLIDTSYAKDYKKFLMEMDKINIDISEIKYILLTHHHYDHTGFVTKLVEEVSCKIIVHKNGIEALKKGMSEDKMIPVNNRIKFVITIFKLFHKKFEYLPVVITNNDIVIIGDDFDLLKEIGVDGKIVYTPGHTKDSISVVLSDGNAFVGDIAMNFLHFCGLKYRPIYIEDIKAVYESWDKLKKMGAEKIYPAHGNPFPIEKLIIKP